LAAAVKHITSCYLHEGRPAVRDCVKCGRPICSQCSQEGDSTALCISCGERAATKGRRKEKPARRSRRRAPVDAGIPSADRAPVPTATTSGRRAAPAPPAAGGEAAPDGTGDGAWQPVGPPVESGHPVAPQRRRSAGPDHVPTSARTERAEGFPSPVEAGKTGVRGEERTERTRARAAGLQRVRREPFEKANAAKDRLKGWYLAMFPVGGKARQILFAVPYGLIAGVGVLAIWIMLAYVTHQWSQYSILVAGVAVSWALFKGTTMKKKDGVPVYDRPPDSILMAVVAVVILAALTPIVELIAYEIIYHGSNAFADPLGHFGSTYFRAFDDVKIFFGFALAFVLPFFLNAGQDWEVPSWLQWILPKKLKKGKKEESGAD
jgi:hypothetical protein